MAEQERTRWTNLAADFETSDLMQREFATLGGTRAYRKGPK